MAKGSGKKVSSATKSRVAFDYIKGQFFRPIRADGAIGGITPNGMIHMVLYSERHAIPRRVVHELNADGTIGDALPEETESRNSVVREMDVDVFLKLDVAESIHQWLGQRIKDAKRRQKATESGGNGQ